MKSIILSLFLLTSIMTVAQTEKPFSIDGILKNVAGTQKVYISYVKAGQRVTDSADVKDGKYTLKGTIQEPVLATLRIKYLPSGDGNVRPLVQQRDIKPVFIGGGKLQVTSVDSFSNVSVKGSAANDEWVKVSDKMKPFNTRMSDMEKQWMAYNKAKDTAGAKKIEEQAETLDEEMKEVYKTYVEANPASPIAPYLVGLYAGYIIDADKAQPLFDKLSPEAKKLPSSLALAERIEIARKTSIGRMALDFTQNDTLGKPVSLSSLKGKVLLVDFWASWCGPCRRENPNVVKAYNQYKDKGFHILGVSLDQPGAKEKWLKAIHDDNLTWTHVSDLKFWDNDVAKDYGIRSIPFNLLLDKDGKIIAKNLRGEALEKKLAEVLL